MSQLSTTIFNYLYYYLVFYIGENTILVPIFWNHSPKKEMATPLPGLYRRSLPFPPAIEFNSSEGALGLGAAATALSSSLYTVDGGQCAVIFNPDLLSTHFSLHSLSLDEPRFVVFGFRSELLTCFCICVCERFSL